MPDSQVLRFEDFELDLSKGLLLQSGCAVPIKGKTFETLCLLAQSDGRLVSREELMDTLWPDSYVEENNLSQHISALRRIFGDRGLDVEYIETVPRRGYRFLPIVTRLNTELPESDILTSETEQPEYPEDVSVGPEMGVAETLALATADTAGPTQAGAVNGSGARGTTPQPIARPRSRRSRGLRRGLKCLIWGVSTTFVFLVIKSILQIYAVMTFENQGALPPEPSPHLTDMVEGLFGLLFIPVLAGYFLGIGLLLYGGARVIYALTQRGYGPGNTSLVEKLLVIGTVAVIGAMAIPNLVASRKLARRARQMQQVQQQQK